jgi:RNA polymerase sigma-70 factor (sigma-E family)
MTLSGSEFDHRFDDLARLAYRVAYRLLGSRADAEDVAQEALARAAARWRKVEPYAEAWITRVATNLALGQIRRRRPAQAGQNARSAHPGTSAAPGSADVEQRAALVAGMRALPRRQREVLALRYLGDLSEAQTAEALGCSVGAVKQHASRGLTAMRRHLDLDPMNDDPPGGLRVRPAR